MKKKFFNVVIFICLVSFSFAQNVGIGTNTPLAKLEIASTNSGILIPRLTTTARNAIANIPKGLLVYDSTAKQFYYHDGTGWKSMSAGTSSLWQLNGIAGTEIKNTNTGGFWSAAATGLNNNSTNITNPITAPVNGPGTRLMWIPSRSAFRAGTVTNGSWDENNIALFSIAMGLNNTASGYAALALGANTKADRLYSSAMGNNSYAAGVKSMAMGNYTIASGDSSTAMGSYTLASGSASSSMGNRTIASGFASTAMGNYTTASGDVSTAIGIGTTASGNGAFASGFASTASRDYSTAMGYTTIASGFASTAIGQRTTASGTGAFASGFASTASTDYSTAMGYTAIASGFASTSIGIGTTASGDYSTAMGSYGSTNGHKGSFIIHDKINENVFGITSNSLDNQMIMKFDGGFGFYAGDASAPSMGFEKTQGLSVYGSNIRAVSGIVSANGVTLTSDKRFKNTIAGIQYGLNTIMQLRPVSYLWNADKVNNNNALKGIQLGFIAQEVEQVIPSAVLTATDSLQSKSIKYMEIIPVLTKAIQEQQTQIEKQQKQNDNLQKQNTEILNRLDKLENK